MKDFDLTETTVNQHKHDVQSVDLKNSASQPKESEAVFSSSRNGKIKSKSKVKTQKTNLGKKSFLYLLIGTFISFAVIITVVVSATFIISYFVAQNSHNQKSQTNITSYMNLLREARYSEIPVSNALGAEGWFEILYEDADGVSTLYSTRAERDSYTLGELYFIQLYGYSQTINVSVFDTNNGKNWLVTELAYDENGERREQYLLLEMLPNGDYSVIEQNISTPYNILTPREFEFFTYNAYAGRGKLYRLSFEGNNGDVYSVVFLDKKEEASQNASALIAFIVCLVVILCALVVFLYVRYINKHVKKPLDELSGAMKDFAIGGFSEKLEYHGSTEFEQLCDSFNEMVSLLNESDEERRALEEDKRRMLAGLSHDLKTPITIIQGFAKAIQDGLVSEQDKQKYLQLISGKAELMSALVNEFYEYTKLDHPDFALDLEKADVAEVARAFYADKYDEFDLRGYQLEASISEDELICNLDKKQITRVFENLTENFFKYTPQGSTLYVGVDRADGNMAKIVFADNGAGIAEESKKDIFAPFVVGEKSRNKQGTGLGLAVCEKIVEAHGGSISISDAPMSGYNLQFEILLPLAQ